MWNTGWSKTAWNTCFAPSVAARLLLLCLYVSSVWRCFCVVCLGAISLGPAMNIILSAISKIGVMTQGPQIAIPLSSTQSTLERKRAFLTWVYLWQVVPLVWRVTQSAACCLIPLPLTSHLIWLHIFNHHFFNNVIFAITKFISSISKF